MMDLRVFANIDALRARAVLPTLADTMKLLAGLEMLATQRALTWAERCAHADLARRVDAIR